jgi:DNA-binding transcriptional LysR family regulator
MDRLEAMSVLIAVVEAGSLTAAGRRLRAPLQTVSRKILELEAHLGARLLQRSTRRLELTEAGADYVAACRRILDDIGEAERKVAGEYATPRGRLALTAPIVFGRRHVAPVIAAFLAAFPEIDVRLTLSDRNLPLFEEHIDLAVRIGALPDSSMIAVQAGEVRLVVCGAPGFFAARGTPKRPDDLAGLPCLSFDALEPSTSWRFEGKRAPVPIRSRLSVNSAEAAIDAAIAGVGVTRVLSYQAAPAVAAGELQIVLAAYEPAPLPVSLLHVAQGPLPLKTRSFIDFALPRLKAGLAQRAG